MNVRDLERLLVGQKVERSRADVATRRLRETGRLRTAGRGLNAHTIDARETALVLMAIAGSAKAAEADRRLDKLLPSVRAKPIGSSKISLLDALERILASPHLASTVVEVRIGRNDRRARIYYDDRIDEFQPIDGAYQDTFFRVEGVLPGALLSLVSKALKGTLPPELEPSDSGEVNDD